MRPSHPLGFRLRWAFEGDSDEYIQSVQALLMRVQQAIWHVTRGNSEACLCCCWTAWPLCLSFVWLAVTPGGATWRLLVVWPVGGLFWCFAGLAVLALIKDIIYIYFLYYMYIYIYILYIYIYIYIQKCL